MSGGRVRWNEKIEGKWKSREKSVHGTKNDAEALKVRVVRALGETGRYDARVDEAAHTPPASLAEGLLAYVDAQATDLKLDAETAKKRRQHVIGTMKGIHAVLDIPFDLAIPVTVLSRPLFDKLKGHWTGTNPNRNLGLLWRAWGWMADDAASWPHIPTCPRRPDGYVPPDKVYGRTVAPTMPHADAGGVRHLRARVEEHGRGMVDTLVCAIIMRYTGLRIGQTLAIHREDLDVANRTLTVRKGKSAQERADICTVPVSRHLLAEPVIQAWLATAPTSGPVLWVTKTIARTVKNAWQDATDAGECPRDRWAPPNRDHTRPDHAYRAALIASMRDAKVDREVWSWLVGQTRHALRLGSRRSRSRGGRRPPADQLDGSTPTSSPSMSAPEGRSGTRRTHDHGFRAASRPT